MEEKSQFDFLVGVTVSRSYGAAAYLIGFGPEFEAVCQRAADASFRTKLVRSPEFLPGATKEQIALGEIKRFGGYDNHEKARSDLEEEGVRKVIRLPKQ